MEFIIGILTFLMVLNALLLVLVILMQLPKKDAGGAGVAFGGGAADALFGAGSGNVLTKITKWATVIFFGILLLLGYLENRISGSGASQFEQHLQQSSQPSQPAPLSVPATPPATAPSSAAPAPGATNNLLAVPLQPGTNPPQK